MKTPSRTAVPASGQTAGAAIGREPAPGARAITSRDRSRDAGGEGASVEAARAYFTDEFRRLGTPERAHGEKAYLKSDLEFYGVSVPAVRCACAAFDARDPRPGREALLAIADDFFAGRSHDLRSAAVGLLERNAALLGPRDLDALTGLLRRSNTWAHADWISTKVVGPVLADHPSALTKLVDWGREPDLWVRRCALIAQVDELRRGRGDFDLFARVAVPMLTEREFFIRKAIGWVLREVGKRRPQLTFDLLAAHSPLVAGLTWREAIKWLPDPMRTRLAAKRPPALPPRARRGVLFEFVGDDDPLAEFDAPVGLQGHRELEGRCLSVRRHAARKNAPSRSNDVPAPGAAGAGRGTRSSPLFRNSPAARTRCVTATNDAATTGTKRTQRMHTFPAFLCLGSLLLTACGGDDFRYAPPGCGGTSSVGGACDGGSGSPGSEGAPAGGGTTGTPAGGHAGSGGGEGGAAGMSEFGGTAGIAGADGSGPNEGQGGAGAAGQGGGGAGGAASTKPVAVVSGQMGLSSFVVDDTSIYYFTFDVTGSLMKAPKDGSGGATKLSTKGGVYMTSDNENLYWAEGGRDRLAHVAKSGGDTTELIEPSFTIFDIQTYDGYVYVASGNQVEDEIYRLGDVSGAHTAVVPEAIALNGMRIFGDTLYWSALVAGVPQISNMSLVTGDAGAVVTGSSEAAFAQLAVDTDYVYWGNRKNKSGKFALARVGKTGGTQSELTAESDGPFRAMIADDDGVYWVTDSAIREYSKSTGTVRDLASHVGSNLYQIAVDADFVYWLEGNVDAENAAVVRVAK